MTLDEDAAGLAGLGRSICSVTDVKLAQIVAVVDLLPARGAADALIAPLRPRLARLQVPRPVHPTRTLFSPADLLIVPAESWTAGMLAFPRPVLQSIAKWLREAGLKLDVAPSPAARPAWWGEAAALLRGARTLVELPGCRRTEVAEIRTGLAAVLAAAGAIQALSQTSPGAAARIAALRPLLATAAEDGTHGVGCVIADLLARDLWPAEVLSVAAELGHAGLMELAMGDRVAAARLRCRSGVAQPGGLVAQAARRTAQLLPLLADMDEDRAAGRQRMERVRKQAAEACRDQFAAQLAATLLTPAAGLTDPVGDDEMDRLEDAARDLCRIEGGGRALGDGGAYDTLRGAAAAAVAAMPGALPRMDRARLIEMLEGADSACAFLRRHPGV
jgi:hypothetical protein